MTDIDGAKGGHSQIFETKEDLDSCKETLAAGKKEKALHAKPVQHKIVLHKETSGADKTKKKGLPPGNGRTLPASGAQEKIRHKEQNEYFFSLTKVNSEKEIADKQTKNDAQIDKDIGQIKLFQYDIGRHQPGKSEEKKQKEIET